MCLSRPLVVRRLPHLLPCASSVAVLGLLAGCGGDPAAPVAAPPNTAAATASRPASAVPPPVGSTTDEPTSAPTVATTRLRVDGTPRGGPPAVDHLVGRTWFGADGTARPLPAAYERFAVVGGELLGVRGVGYAYGGTTGTLDVVDGEGEGEGALISSEPIRGMLVTSPSGATAAWATAAGDLLTQWDAGDRGRVVMSRDSGRVTASAVLGDGSCYEQPDGSGCVLFYESGTQVRYTTSHGIDDDVGPSIAGVSDVRARDGALLVHLAGGGGQSDDGCRGLLVRGRGLRWRTWDHLPYAFSPDGRLILAGEPTATEPTSVVVLDAGTGDPVRRFEVDGTVDGHLLGAIWEDDDHLLITIGHPQRRSRLVRAGLDGGTDLPLGPEPLALVLPDRP